MAYIYMVKCEDDSIYTGIAMDIKKRMAQHLSGNGAKYTKSHKVTELLALWTTENYSDAAKLEYRIKQLDKPKKMRLLENKGSVNGMFSDLNEVEFKVIENASLENLP